MARTIVVKGRGIRKELNAGGVINPGHLIKIAADGDAEVHSTAGGLAATTFACENELFGKGVTEEYAVGDRVLYEHLFSGQEVYARVAAGADAVALGDFLQSAGDGTLEKAVDASQEGTTPFAYTAGGAVIAQALEAVDNSGGSEEAFILCQII